MSLDPASTAASPWSELPEVPGGWTLNRVRAGDESFELVQPTCPDDFLEDPDVLAANRRDDYMPYWSYLWPASVDMAVVLQRADFPTGTEALELGSGVGLVGLAGLKCGWRVTFSDYDPVAVACSLINARRNSLAARASGLHLDWRTPIEQQWPFIFGCEVTYERRNHPVLLDLLDRMLAPQGVSWFGDPGRSQAPNFLELARQRGFRTRILDGALRERSTPLTAEFQLLELTHPAGR
jgi:predicted nicotinamide N-methyase